MSRNDAGPEDQVTLPPHPTSADASHASAPDPARVPPELSQHPRYRVLRLLGAGGMGAVYLAQHALMDRPVALKTIKAGLLADPAALARFRQEVKLAARLAHSNIVAAHDADLVGGLHFLVMEFVEGVSLAELVGRRGPLPVAQACAAVRQAALGLQHAHEQNLVHRDIKPGNLMRTAAGQVKILDFGLARLAQRPDQADDEGLTGTNVIMGTGDYIAPEQTHDSHSVDIRADIYSLGCTLYFLLTGRPPFPGGSFLDKIIRHATDTPPPLAALRPEVPAALAAVVERMMAKRPADRFQTPAEVAEALAPFSVPTPPALNDVRNAVAASAGSARRPSRRGPGRGRSLAVIGIGLVALPLLAAGAILLGFRPPPPGGDIPAPRLNPREGPRPQAAAVQRAGYDGDWFIITGNGKCWSNNEHHPAYLTMQEFAREGETPHCFAFDPNDGWVTLGGHNRFHLIGVYEGDLLLKRLKEVGASDSSVQCLAFTPQGGWALLHDRSDFSAHGVPEEAVEALAAAKKRKHLLRSLTFAPSGAWALLYDGAAGTRGVTVEGDLGKEVYRKLVAFANDGVARCLAFTGKGEWFILAGAKGFWSNAPDHPASRKLAELHAAGHSLEWIAFTPGESPTGYVLQRSPARRVKAVLRNDITQPKSQVTHWYNYAPRPPELPGQGDVAATFAPGGEAITDLSPEKRPLFLSRAGQPKETHLALTVEATLYKRRLLPRTPHQPAPVVAELSADEVRRYTRATPTLDCDEPALRDWIAARKLRRGDGEGDLAFARRVFLFLKQQFAYTAAPGQECRASRVCKAGKADCGGLCALYVAVLRANGVPARLLVGRWAQSEPGVTCHVKAEFFARGVGWVPVDVSLAVTETSRGALSYFGNDAGEFVTFHVDPDIRVQNPPAGEYSEFGIQEIWSWWQGSGSDEGRQAQQRWTVESRPAAGP
jgi:transglutaminase-like putative cysteine protease